MIAEDNFIADSKQNDAVQFFTLTLYTYKCIMTADMSEKKKLIKQITKTGV